LSIVAPFRVQAYKRAASPSPSPSIDARLPAMTTDLSRFDDSDDGEDDFFARVRARELADDDDGDEDAREPPSSRTAAGDDSDDGDDARDAPKTRPSKLERAREKKRRAKQARAKRRKLEGTRAVVSEDDDAAAPSDDVNGDGERVHHGTFKVEGIVMDGELVLVDKKNKAVYSSTERLANGEHVRIGTWDEATQSYSYWKPAETKKEDGAREGKRMALNERGETIPAIFKGDAKLAEEFKAPKEVEHPFETDADDHCETSPEAHENVVNFLKAACEQLNKSPAELIIYDPYYCAGGTRRNLALIGFTNVINRNEDFYKVIEENRVPEHDVFLTNPPYSADHIEKCVAFAAENLAAHGRPYMLLLPSYVIHKEYYVPALLTGGSRGKEKAKELAMKRKDDERGSDDDDASDSDGDENVSMKIHGGGKSRAQILPFYVAPKKRYYYWTPKALVKARAANKGENEESAKARRKRTHIGALGERTSPFLSFWYCCFGEKQRDVLAWHKKLPRSEVYGYVLARHPNDLPLAVLDEWDPRRIAAVEKAKADGVELPQLSSYAGFTGASKTGPAKKFYK
jgi:hypothetical protein